MARHSEVRGMRRTAPNLSARRAEWQKAPTSASHVFAWGVAPTPRKRQRSLGARQRFLCAVAVVVVGALAGRPAVLRAQGVRVVPRAPARADSLVGWIFAANVADVKRMIAEWREREEQLGRELQGVSEADFPARRRVEGALALHLRDGFAMMSAIEARCLNERKPQRLGYIGVNLDTEIRVVDREARSLGTWVTSVEPGSPAERAGVQRGDRVVSIAGLDARERLPDVSGMLEPGRTIEFRVERDSTPREFAIVVARRPEGFGESCGEFERVLQPMRIPATTRVMVTVPRREPRSVDALYERRDSLPDPGPEMRVIVFGPGAERAFFAGAEFRALDADWREVLGVRQGVIVNAVASGSAAAQAGLKGGDVVTAVGASAAISPVMLAQMLGVLESREVRLTVVRGKARRTLVLRWGEP